MRWARHLAHMGKRKVQNRILLGIPEGKRPLGRPMRRWEENIKIYPQEIGWKHGLHLSGSGEEQMAGAFESSNVRSL
jgi:hypothetical protein